MGEPDVTDVTWVYGPLIECSGKYQGCPWYFRVRSNGNWSFGLAEDADMDPQLISSSAMGFYVRGSWGDDHLAIIAGLRMPPQEAQRIIEECLERYSQSSKGAA